MNKKLFLFLALILPLNLGKHFIFRESYINGILIDYLVPTIYLQDLVMLFIVSTLDFTYLKTLRKNYPVFLSILFYLLFTGVSIFYSDFIYSSIFNYGRLMLLLGTFLVSLQVFKDKVFLKKFVLMLTISTFLVCILGVFQWFKQSSVFDNYLFFGEQPYTTSTYGISLKNYFGQVRIPPYGVFRHPNIFAGFLFVSLFLFVSFGVVGFRKNMVFKYFSVLVLSLGLLLLFLSLSNAVWLCLGMSCVALLLYVFNKKLSYVFAFSATIILIALGLFLPEILVIKNFDIVDLGGPSLTIRSHFLTVGYKSIHTFSELIFGIGFNNFFTVLRTNLVPGYLNFIQPIHNIFVLIIVESGFLSLVCFIYTYCFILLKNFVPEIRDTKRDFTAFMLTLLLLMILVIGSFDHYFLTIHQTQILLWLTLGISLAYNSK